MQEYGIVRWRVVAICHITLSNAHDGPSMLAVIIQVKQRDRRASRQRLPYNAQTVCVPGKMIRPPLRRGLNSGTKSSVSGSRPSTRSPRRSLQLRQAKAKLSSASEPQQIGALHGRW